MGREQDAVYSGAFTDLTKFIRSIQRIEGNPDCFGRGIRNCDPRQCSWGEYCIKASPKESGGKEV